MKLSTWARQQGLSYKTAWRLWKAGKLPVPAEQLATGTVIRQLSRLAEFSVAHGFRVVEAARETGSGLHGRRQALLRIFRNPKVHVIVVEHGHRLMRLGLEYVEAALAVQGRRLVVVDGAEINDDMVRDLQEVNVSLCARLYGKRAAKNRANKAMETIQCEWC